MESQHRNSNEVVPEPFFAVTKQNEKAVWLRKTNGVVCTLHFYSVGIAHVQSCRLPFYTYRVVLKGLFYNIILVLSDPILIRGVAYQLDIITASWVSSG